MTSLFHWAYVHAAYETVIYVVYALFFQIYSLLQVVYRTKQNTAKIPSGHGRVSAIVIRKKRDPEDIAITRDFVSIHESFKPLASFLNEYWALYCFDNKNAVFVELPKPHVEYQAKDYPFMFIPLFEQAIRVAYVPIDDFVAYCAQLNKKPQSRTVLYTNTARCGSTLLAQMLCHKGVSVCYAEPQPLMNLGIGMDEGYYSIDYMKKVLPAAITYLRKDVPADQLCVLKTSSYEARLVPFTEGMDNLQHIFMFRKNGLGSVERMMKRDKAMTYFMKLYLWNPQISNLMSYLVAGEGKFMRELQPKTIVEWAALSYAAPYSHYLKNKDKYLTIVWHHDLIRDPEKTIQNLFDKLQIPSECVPNALKCMDYDSQDGTFLSRKAIAKIKASEPTAEEVETFKLYCKHMEIPEWILLADK
ncbi:hypothetical protein L596_016735 [Steinernema carpocapsae]|uniref:Sulfotransferase domain-containing protein n=1 Tax=Steinernema carpocapsae TaxID=34508 RepID=A0A4U5NJP5_STECR|nr:hypothetical protein L596_016735 [Steinernema carpocapsae]